MPIRIHEYDQNWKKIFEKEKENIESSLPDHQLTVIHFGSTSIDGACSKNIIDMACIVKPACKSNKIIAVLKKIGYGTGGIHFLPDRICLTKTDLIHFHLYLVEQDSRIIKDWIDFRDAISGSRDLLNRYCSIKKELAVEFPNIHDYTEGKTAFIMEVLNGFRK